MSQFTLRELAVIAISLDDEENSSRKGRNRRYWVHNMLKARSSDGEYQKIMRHLLDDEEKFFMYFHMDRYLFYYILSFIQNDITKRNTKFRQAITPEERFAVTLRYMITGSTIRTMSSSFRIGESSIRSIMQEVCTAIINKLMGLFIPIPTVEQWRSIADGFQNRWNFPNCIGAIDGKHVNIIAPPNSGSLYFNYKKHFSIVLLAVVDDKYRFTAVDVGSYGRNSDGGIFASSKLAGRIESKSLNIPNDKPLPGSDREMPHVFVGDEAFPLMKNLLRPYPRSRGLTEPQKLFNERLSRARKVVEDGFGILYQKFGIYNKNINMHPKHVDKMIVATCILHNIMRTYEIELNRNEHDARQQTNNNVDGLRDLLHNDDDNSSINAFNIRDIFSSYFQSPEGQISW